MGMISSLWVILPAPELRALYEEGHHGAALKLKALQGLAAQRQPPHPAVLQAQPW